MARVFIPGIRFHALTPHYDRLARLVGLGEPFRRWELGLLDGLAPRRVLEIGCGTGELTLAVARRFPNAEPTVLDPDPKMLAQAQAKFAKAAVAVRAVEGSAQALPFDDGEFDLVLSSLMLHHLKTRDKHAALREVRRVLQPGGALVLVDFGPPQSRLARALLWPLELPVLEEQADNFRGRIPGFLVEAGFEPEEAGRYRGIVHGWRARPVG